MNPRLHLAARRGQWLALPAGAVVAVLVGVVVAPHLTSVKSFELVVGGLAGALALGAAIALVDPAWVLAIGLALTIFSGDWQYLHLPGPVDRVVVVAGVIAFIVRAVRDPTRTRPQVRAIHGFLVVLILYAFGSAAWSGTLSQHQALYELLDRLGFFPFLLYFLGHAAFATEARRRLLLWTLVVTGLYLGLMSVFQEVGPHALVIPSFIRNPAIGIHADRARGPFLEAGANGLAMFSSAVAAAMLLAGGGRPRRQWFLAFVIVLSAVGILLTLTRQVWIGAAVGTLVALGVSSRYRRHIPRVVVVGVVVVLAALFLIPGLHSKVSGRADSKKPVWDRLNSDSAALRMIETRPLLGFGWGQFPNTSSRYYHVAGHYPLSSVPEVHNVVLSNGAELGILGLALWLFVLIWAVLGAYGRRAPPELELWRLGMVAIVIAWFVQANFAPVSYAYDNYIPWLFAGIAYGIRPTRGGALSPATAVVDGPLTEDPRQSLVPA